MRERQEKSGAEQVIDYVPRLDAWDFQAPPEDATIAMEFRLIYRGSLPSESRSTSRPKEKHAIRKQLHQQLERYWREHPHLRRFLGAGNVFGCDIGHPDNLITKLAKQFSRSLHRYVPLAREV